MTSQYNCFSNISIFGYFICYFPIYKNFSLLKIVFHYAYRTNFLSKKNSSLRNSYSISTTRKMIIKKRIKIIVIAQNLKMKYFMTLVLSNSHKLIRKLIHIFNDTNFEKIQYIHTYKRTIF